PTTADTSTLSLHDALPIFDLGASQFGSTAQGAAGIHSPKPRRIAPNTDTAKMTSASEFARLVAPLSAAELASGVVRNALLINGRDRKSTRLNSSHDQISYA